MLENTILDVTLFFKNRPKVLELIGPYMNLKYPAISRSTTDIIMENISTFDTSGYTKE